MQCKAIEIILNVIRLKDQQVLVKEGEIKELWEFFSYFK